MLHWWRWRPPMQQCIAGTARRACRDRSNRVPTRMALKLGLNLGYWGIGPQGDDAAKIVKDAERLGFESVWAAESYGSDVVSVLAWLAAQTETINLGAAIMQVPARPPAPAAMAGCTIDALS